MSFIVILAKKSNLKQILLTALAFISLLSYSQKEYPQDYFNAPLDIEPYLSGTFGELRSNHFHAGLDYKTQQREGFNVYSSAEGYVSRIKISHWGYGKALYITHPNGYTTVYAHLKKFSPKIEAYIRKKQYEQESFEIQVFPEKDELKVDKKEIIAYSGATGGFIGPHLHFEIRDAYQRPINPFLFGFKVKDTQAPIINDLMIYPLDNESHLNGKNAPQKINFNSKADGKFYTNTLNACGNIGIGIKTYDRLDGALNKNGPYSVRLFVNGSEILGYQFNTFSFAETKQINFMIDYPKYKKEKNRIQKSYIVPENNLSIYGKKVNNGIIRIENEKTYNLKLIVADFAGNTTELIIPITGKEEKIQPSKEETKPYLIVPDSSYVYRFKNNTNVIFDKNTFYKNTFIDISTSENNIKFHHDYPIVKKAFKVKFDSIKFNNEKEKRQSFIATIKSNGRKSFNKTVKKEDSFYITTKELGNFAVLRDSVAPKIELKNFNDKQWVTHYQKLVIKIKDDLSGIKSYRGEIDGKWVLLEYSPKYQTLTFNFENAKFSEAKHNFKIRVRDNVGNETIKEVIFYRKK